MRRPSSSAALSRRQLDRMDREFDRLAGTELMPACEAWQDPARKELDQVVLADILGADTRTMQELESIRAKWCQEPTVQGRKGATAPNAGKMMALAHADLGRRS